MQIHNVLPLSLLESCLLSIYHTVAYSRTLYVKCEWTWTAALKLYCDFGWPFLEIVCSKNHMGMPLSHCLCMLHGFIYDVCQHELAVFLMIQNVNKHQFDARLHFLTSKCLLTQVRLPYESNQRRRVVGVTRSPQYSLTWADKFPN